MEKEKIIAILNAVRNSKMAVEKAIEKLRHLPFEDMGFAKVDHHRPIRSGAPEVIFCPGKTIPQIEKIFKSIARHNKSVLLTRADKKIYTKVRAINRKAAFNSSAGAIFIKDGAVLPKGNVLVICAGTADLPVAEEAAVTLEVFANRIERIFDVGVAGFHRLLRYYDKISRARCIVAVAGMEGALASVVGGLASCPVIAVPTSIGYGTNYHGIAPLLTMLNSCAPNVTVVNIDNGFGAGYVASLINQGAAAAQEPVPGALKPRLITPEGKGRYQRLLGGPPESCGMRSGFVTLKKGESIGEHSTQDKEEFIIVLSGQGRMRIKHTQGFSLTEKACAYVPPQTLHDVKNTGRKPLQYIYVVSPVR